MVLVLFVGPGQPAATAGPAPHDPEGSPCSQYSHFKRLSPTEVRITGGITCVRDQLLTMGITVQVNGKVKHAKGIVCTNGYRQCSMGYTAKDKKGKQKYEILVETYNCARNQIPIPTPKPGDMKWIHGCDVKKKIFTYKA